MNTTALFRLALFALLLTLGLSSRAEEMVTIPKSRLTELEQKEKELNALKTELGRARGETQKLKREKETAESERAKAERETQKLMAAKAAAEAKAALAQAAAANGEPVIAHDTPALATLPPLKKDEVVDALDLMNHYRADAVGAESRYGHRRIRVRGVVTAFDKPLFASHYIIVLRTTERAWRIECDMVPARELTATYLAQQGETLVGVMASGARLTLARVGQTVEIEAAAKGLKKQTLSCNGGRLMATE